MNANPRICVTDSAPPERDTDRRLARAAAAIGEPARARILCCLLDGRARTSTELAIVANVGAPTASAHLQRLRAARLVKVSAQGKHRYYSLATANVARALESLSIISGCRLSRLQNGGEFSPSTPGPLRAARTCYDHIAGKLGVALHDRMFAMAWIAAGANGARDAYELTRKGEAALARLGICVEPMRAARRRFAFACLDWSERRPHVGGALGAALLETALRKKWVLRELDSRALEITPRGRREMLAHFGLSSLAQ